MNTVGVCIETISTLNVAINTPTVCITCFSFYSVGPEMPLYPGPPLTQNKLGGRRPGKIAFGAGPVHFLTHKQQEPIDIVELHSTLASYLQLCPALAACTTNNKKGGKVSGTYPETI